MDQHHTMKSRPETPANRTAWQGLQLNGPTDWEVSGYSGDYAEGYLRVNDVEHVPMERNFKSWTNNTL